MTPFRYDRIRQLCVILQIAVQLHATLKLQYSKLIRVKFNIIIILIVYSLSFSITDENLIFKFKLHEN